MAKNDFRFEFDEEDIKTLNNILKGFGEIDGNKAIMNSLSIGVREIVKQGKSNLASSNEVKKGNLKNSFGTRRVKKWLSAYGGFKRSGPHKGNHAHLIDRGTDERYTKKGYYRGSVSKGRPNTGSRFWTKAVESTGPRSIEKTMNVIYNELEKIINKKK